MCMEDIRIGRRTIHTPRNLSLTVSSKLATDYSEKRTQLMFYPPPSGTATFYPGNTVVANVGITLGSTSHPILMTVETHGDLVKQRWSAIHSAGGVSVFVSEGYLDES